MSSNIDSVNDHGLLIFVGIPILLTAFVVIFAVIYARHMRRKALLALSIPRSQRKSVLLTAEQAPLQTQGGEEPRFVKLNEDKV
jgi:hypothetical protein